MDKTRQIEEEVAKRAGGACELCQSAEALALSEVPPAAAAAHQSALLCGLCREQINGASALDAKHWFCLQESAWSEVPAVQVLSVRMLRRLAEEGWAQDLLGQIYLDEETQAWADAELGEGEGDDAVVTCDSNGAVLADGDSVTLIKDLDVKGGGFVAKRGTMVKNIRLIDDPENIEGRVNKITLVLKTKFLKKVG